MSLPQGTLTFTLANGVIVLAKGGRVVTETADYFKARPCRFTSHTQAERKALALHAMGEQTYVYVSPTDTGLFYVAFERSL